MDDLFLTLAAVLRWRVTVAVAGAIVLAIAAFRLIPWLGGLQAIAIVIAGFIAGLVWEDRAGASSPVKTVSDRTTSKSVAMLAFALGGGVWGAVSSTSLGSAILGGLLLVVCLLLGNRHAMAKQQAATPGYAGACFASATLAYAMAVLLIGLLRVT